MTIFQDHIRSIAARSEQDWFRIEAKAGTDVASVYLYDEIGMWGTTAADFASEVAGLDVNEIHLHINSPGGSAWDGLAIMNTLRQHKAKVTVSIDGIAASAASFIAMAGDEIVMSQGSRLMIHNSSGVCIGPSAAMRKTADVLDGVNASMAKIYAARAGGSEQDWLDAMAEESWYSDEEAVAAGLADRVEQAKPNDKAAAKAHFAETIAAFLGRPVGEPTPEPPTASADGTTKTEGGSAVDLTTEQITMRQKLGIAEDADEATLLAALDEALNERAESKPVSTNVPEGHVVIPATQLADLQAGAALATETAKALHEQERAAFLDSVRSKYLPTSRAGWEVEYDRDAAGVKAYFETASVLIPTTELGQGNGDSDRTSDDLAYDALYDNKQEA